MSRRFPNDPPLLVQLLRFLHKRYATLGWEARYITLMWLSLVLAAPYALTEMLANVRSVSFRFNHTKGLTSVTTGAAGGRGVDEAGGTGSE